MSTTPNHIRRQEALKKLFDKDFIDNEVKQGLSDSVEEKALSKLKKAKNKLDSLINSLNTFVLW